MLSPLETNNGHYDCRSEVKGWNTHIQSMQLVKGLTSTK